MDQNCPAPIQEKTENGAYHQKETYVCLICNKSLRSSNKHYLETHKRTHPGKISLQLVNLRQDTKTHAKEKPFYCSRCKMIFTKVSYLRQHIVKHNHHREKPYACSVCDKTFSESFHLKGHHTTHLGKKPFVCPVCDKHIFTTNQFYFAQHQKSHLNNIQNFCTFCDEDLPKIIDLNEHNKVHIGDRPFVCFQCVQNFQKLSHLKRHKQSHSEEKYVALIRDKSSSQSPKSIQSIKKLYTCTECGDEFDSLRSLTSHITQSHKTVKPYTCSFCTASFKKPLALKRHIITHTRNRFDKTKYKCTLCEQLFSTNVELKTHNMIHTGKTPLICSQCDMTFFLLKPFKKHVMKGHVTPYKCSQCDDTFSKLKNIRNHDCPRLSGVVPMRCNICHMALTQNKVRDSLLHMFRCKKTDQLLESQNKIEEKMYKCTHCVNSFSTNIEFKRHIINHTGKTPSNCSHVIKYFSNAKLSKIIS